MIVKTYLSNHPEIKQFYLQSKDRLGGLDSFCLCCSDNFDDLNHFGNYKIKSVNAPPESGELMTLFV